MFGLIVHVEELMVIFHVVNCYTVDESSVWMIQGVFMVLNHPHGPLTCVTVHCTENYQQFFYMYNYNRP